MSLSPDSLVWDLSSLVSAGLEPFSPQTFGGQQAPPQQQQQQQFPYPQQSQHQMFGAPQQAGSNKPSYLDVGFSDYSLLSPGSESGYGSSCSVGQPSPMSRNVGGSPAPPPLRPTSRTTPGLDGTMENCYITDASNTLYNHGAVGYEAFDNQNNAYDAFNSSFDTTYERGLDTSYGSPAPGYSSPFIESTCDSPYSLPAPCGYEPLQQPEQQEIQQEKQYRAPPGKLLNFFLFAYSIS